MYSIIRAVKATVSYWNAVAKEIGISRMEQEIMASAFRY